MVSRETQNTVAREYQLSTGSYCNQKSFAANYNSETITSRIVPSHEFEKEGALRQLRKHTISLLPLLLLFKEYINTIERNYILQGDESKALGFQVDCK